MVVIDEISKEKPKKYAVMFFKVEIEDSDTTDQIIEKMYGEAESYIDVVGIRMDCISIINEDTKEKDLMLMAEEILKL
jgi:hypothetical protein